MAAEAQVVPGQVADTAHAHQAHVPLQLVAHQAEGAFDPGFDLYTEYGGGVTITIGHGSVATPGTPQMLVELHRRAGRAS